MDSPSIVQIRVWILGLSTSDELQCTFLDLVYLCCRVIMMQFLHGRSNRRSHWCWLIRSTIVDTCQTHSAQIPRVPASRSRRCRWTSPADVHCLLNKKCWKMSVMDCTCRMTPSSLKWLLTQVICWIHNGGEFRFKTMLLGDWPLQTSHSPNLILSVLVFVLYSWQLLILVYITLNNIFLIEFFLFVMISTSSRGNVIGEFKLCIVLPIVC